MQNKLPINVNELLKNRTIESERIVKTELYRTGSFVVGLSNHNDRYP